MIKNIVHIFIIIAACACLYTAAYALNAYPDTAYPAQNKDLTINLALNTGFIMGRMNEFVFENGAKVSELNWDLMPVYYLGGNLRIQFKKIFFSFGFQAGLNIYTGSINDYDWNDYGVFTNFSHHVCELDAAHFLDWNLYYLLFKQYTITLVPAVGVSYKLIKVRSIDGYLQYPPGSIKRDIYGTGIAYKQEYIIPYFGFGVSTYYFDAFSMGLYFYYSPFAVCNARDNHYRTSTDFYDRILFGQYISIGIEASYRLTANGTVFVDFDYSRMVKSKGDSFNINTSTGERSETFSKGAGVEFGMFNISAGFRYTVFSL